MKIIKTIDLWTEQFENQYECFNGAFIDGVTEQNIPFDAYKIILHCNCKISVDKKDIFIGNKHQAIVFYKSGTPVRLVVAKEKTDITKCITNALNQTFGEDNLKTLFEKNNISSSYADMAKTPIYNGNEKAKEIDVGSCDRWALLYSMLKGSYTESDSP